MNNNRKIKNDQRQSSIKQPDGNKDETVQRFLRGIRGTE